jgi:hypothetical protein
MKKLFFISVLVCFAGINQLFSANPIPSYNVLVLGKASFQESTKPIIGNTVPDEKRQMNVQSSTASPTKGFAGFILRARAYRLDGSMVLGPFYFQVGQTLQISIDDRAWGVEISSDQPSRESVWIVGEQGN